MDERTHSWSRETSNQLPPMPSFVVPPEVSAHESMKLQELVAANDVLASDLATLSSREEHYKVKLRKEAPLRPQMLITSDCSSAYLQRSAESPLPTFDSISSAASAPSLRHVTSPQT